MIQNIDWREGIKNVGDSSVDLVLTDPPYGIGFRSNHRRVRYDKIEEDDNLSWLPDLVKELGRVCKDDAHLYVFCSWHNVDVFKTAFNELFEIKNILIWFKNNTGMGDLTGDYAPQYEMILFCSNGEKPLNGRRDSNIIRYARTGNIYHPSEKPVGLMKYFIQKSTQKGDMVIDPFSGSGPVAMAAEELDRRFICFEINEQYYKTSIKRMGSITKELF